jgi:hypothetical protein
MYFLLDIFCKGNYLGQNIKSWLVLRNVYHLKRLKPIIQFKIKDYVFASSMALFLDEIPEGNLFYILPSPVSSAWAVS